MKHFINVAGTILIIGAVAIAGIGSYRSHTRSARLEELPPDVPIEIDHPVEYVELAPVAGPPVIEPAKVKGEIFIPVDLPMLRETDFVNLTYEEQCLLLDIAMAEAEGEDSVGKALVMITVLNRTEHYSAPVGEIIYAPKQFAVGRMGIQPSEDCYEALGMVIDGWNESWIEGDWDHDKKILWFSADGYPMYGEPMFQYGGHYFSGL